MDRWQGKVAIVTGASSGIGAAIVENLVNDGLQVVGLARRKDRLEELAKKLSGKAGKLHPYVADVTKEEDILGAFKWTRKNVGPLGILVNNAGVTRITTLTDGETQLWKDVLDTNVMALCIATREAVRAMKADKIDGHIVHINSIAGHKPVSIPKFNVYPASKYAVTALTESLRTELVEMGSKIKISSISPGYVSTEIFETCFNVSTEQVENEFKEVLNTVPALLSKDIADAVSYVLGTPPHVQVHELIIQPVGEKF